MDEERMKRQMIDLLRVLRCRRPAKSTIATYNHATRRRQTAETVTMISTAVSGKDVLRSSPAPEVACPRKDR